jgi:hypothetical protein
MPIQVDLPKAGFDFSLFKRYVFMPQFHSIINSTQFNPKIEIKRWSKPVPIILQRQPRPVQPFVV